MKRSRFAKCLAVGVVLTASALVATFDCQARQSNVYSVNVVSGIVVSNTNGFNLVSAGYLDDTLEHDWIFKLPKGHYFGLQQLRKANYSGQKKNEKAYTLVWLGTYPLSVPLPAKYVAIIFGAALLLACWALIAGLNWLLNKRGMRDVQSSQETIRPP